MTKKQARKAPAPAKRAKKDPNAVPVRRVALPKKNIPELQKAIDEEALKVRRPITIKQARIIRYIAQGKSKREAGRLAGFTGSDETVSVSVSNALKEPNVKIALREALAKAGVDVDGVASVIANGMKAERITVLGSGPDAIADMQPDHSIRLRAVQLAAKYLGAEEPENKDTGGNTFNFIKTDTFNASQYVRQAE